MTTIVHVVNQFFAGLGSEEKGIRRCDRNAAGRPAVFSRNLAGSEDRLHVYYGDNYFHEHNEDAKKALLDAVRTRNPKSSSRGRLSTPGATA
jgi:glycine reductase